MKQEQVTVYIIRSSNENYYCGISNDVARRVYEHNQGRKGYTRRFTEWAVVWSYAFYNRSLARQMEVIIKNYGVRRWFLKHSPARPPDGARANDGHSQPKA